MSKKEQFEHLIGKKIKYKLDGYFHYNGGIVRAINEHGHALIEKDNNQLWIWADLLEIEKPPTERLLIIDDDSLEFLVFDSLDLEELKTLLEEAHHHFDFGNKDIINKTLKWYGEDGVYYFYINDNFNIVLTDVIER